MTRSSGRRQVDPPSAILRGFGARSVSCEDELFGCCALREACLMQRGCQRAASLVRREAVISTEPGGGKASGERATGWTADVVPLARQTGSRGPAGRHRQPRRAMRRIRASARTRASCEKRPRMPDRIVARSRRSVPCERTDRHRLCDGASPSDPGRPNHSAPAPCHPLQCFIRLRSSAPERIVRSKPTASPPPERLAR